MNFMSRKFLYRFSINLNLALDKSGGKGTSNLVCFFRDLHLIKINQDSERKVVDVWFQFNYVLDFAEGTESKYTVIG